MGDTGKKISRVYSNFRGVDFRGEEINLVRSPDSLNVWKDYSKTESIRTRPALKKLRSGSDTVYGIYFFRGKTIVHQGTSLIEYDDIAADGLNFSILGTVFAAPSNGFVYEDKWYFKDGVNYLCYNGSSLYKVADNSYVPTTTIGRKPEGGGTVHEDVNMLSPYRINTFLADGIAKEYLLDTMNIDDDYVPVVKVNGETVIYAYANGTKTGNFEVDYKAGKITFKTAPLAPNTDGQDNVSIRFKKDVIEYREAIEKSTLLQVFDNRVFFSGNKEHPNVVWHCSLNDPSYVSDRDYYNEGMDEAAVKGMVAGNNALWVFREPSDSNTNVFYHTPTIDDVYGKIYPSSHSSVTAGCVGKAINFNDDIVFFSERGMEGISGDITTEQVLAHRSTMVDGKMMGISRKVYEKMVLVEWEGYLLVFIGSMVFLADSRAVFTNENHIEYEWFYWELEKDVTCAKVHDGLLYVGTEDGGVYTLNDYSYTTPLESYWVTPKDKFEYPHMLKTTNKRGCVAEAMGDIEVYAKLEDTGFELIGKYEDVKDYFVSRIKRKKFKDIQLKFRSNTGFSLETVTLEAWIGGYIKR